VQYVHTPFTTFQHVVMDGAVVERFTNLSFGYELTSNLTTLTSYRFNAYACNATNIVDKCWDDVFNVSNMRGVANALPALRERFAHAAGRLPHLTVANRSDVVMHIRRGDSRWRWRDNTYFARSIVYVRNFTAARNDAAPHFFIATDDVRWGHLATLVHAFPGQVTVLPNTEHVLVTFNRMANAYALICSESSFSFAAILVNARSQLNIVPNASLNIDPQFAYFFENPALNIIKL